MYLIEGIGWNEQKGKGYLHGRVNGEMVSAQVLLMGKPMKGFENDHKDRNRRNNRRDNLRVVTIGQNQANNNLSKRNKSGFKGVYWRKQENKWCAQIKNNGETIYLGLFTNLREAAKAYDVKAVELFGEYAATNKVLGLLK